MWDDNAPQDEKLEDFAREYVRTGNLTTAIQRARVQNPLYRLSVWGEKLLARDDVKALVARYKAEGVEKPKDYTRDSIVDDLQEVFEVGVREGNLGPAVQAKRTQAEMLGLLDKNVNVRVTGSVMELSTADLERELRRLQGEGVIALPSLGVNDDGIEVFGGDAAAQ